MWYTSDSRLVHIRSGTRLLQVCSLLSASYSAQISLATCITAYELAIKCARDFEPPSPRVFHVAATSLNRESSVVLVCVLGISLEVNGGAVLVLLALLPLSQAQEPGESGLLL